MCDDFGFMLVSDSFLLLSISTFGFISWLSILSDDLLQVLFYFITSYSHVKEIFEFEQSPLIGKKVLYGTG